VTAVSAPAEEPTPLSPAQVALFQTPLLANVTQPEALEFRFERTGGAPLTDTASERIVEIHPDGKKLVTFDFLTSEHHELFPGVDDVAGNPLLMVFLEHDVREMARMLDMPAEFFRELIRDSFSDRAKIETIQYDFGGKTVPARRVTVQPFTDEPRLQRLLSVKQKQYSFIICEQTPGKLAEISASMPGEPSVGAPPWSERLVFVGEKP
jgi:hypothetical protein